MDSCLDLNFSVCWNTRCQNSNIIIIHWFDHCVTKLPKVSDLSVPVWIAKHNFIIDYQTMQSPSDHSGSSCNANDWCDSPAWHRALLTSRPLGVWRQTGYIELSTRSVLSISAFQLILQCLHHFEIVTDSVGDATAQFIVPTQGNAFIPVY